MEFFAVLDSDYYSNEHLMTIAMKIGSILHDFNKTDTKSRFIIHFHYKVSVIMIFLVSIIRKLKYDLLLNRLLFKKN